MRPLSLLHPLLLALAAAGCAASAPSAARPAAAPIESSAAGPAQDLPVPVVDTSDGADWVRLRSGEWVKGKIVTYDRKTLELDSAELGLLKIDWKDVVEIRTARDFTIVLEGPVEEVGVLRMLDDEVFLSDGSGTRRFPRSEVFRMVPGHPSEANYWSGRLVLGGTARSGNTDQVDVTALVSALRRTARSRLPLSYEAAYGQLDGQRNTDNQKFLGRYDRFLGSDLFVTPLGLELYRDAFQNLALRAAPYTGLGYTLTETGRVEWSVNAGLGYRYTRFDSVEAGQDDADGSATAIAGTTVRWEPSGTVDVDLTYTAQVGLEDTSDTNQTARLGLSVDLWWDFDLNVRLGWDRVGLPQADADGNLPQKDDFRLSVGLAWSF